MKEEVIVTVSGEEKLQAREEDDRNPMNSTVLRKMNQKVTSFLFLMMSYQWGNISKSLAVQLALN